MKLSVIIPIYKVEKYLRKCLDSVVKQDLQNVEIILVDDGSVDLCPQICDEYANRYDCIKVLHKENGGLVSARKAGVEISVGDYVTFIDGDDYIEDGYFENIITILSQYTPDMVVYNNYNVVSDDGESKLYHSANYSGYYNKDKLNVELLPSVLYKEPFFTFGIGHSVWTKIFKRSLIVAVTGNIPNEIRMGEDLALSLPCVLKANGIYFSDFAGYDYRQNYTSMSRTYNSEEAGRIENLLSYLYKVTRGYESYDIDNQLEYYAMFMLQFQIKMLVSGSSDIANDLKSLDKLFENNLVKAGIKKKLPLKTRLWINSAQKKRILTLKLFKRILEHR